MGSWRRERAASRFVPLPGGGRERRARWILSAIFTRPALPHRPPPEQLRGRLPPARPERGGSTICATRLQFMRGRLRWSARLPISAASGRARPAGRAACACRRRCLDPRRPRLVARRRGSRQPCIGERHADPCRQRDGRLRHHAAKVAGRQPGDLPLRRTPPSRRWPPNCTRRTAPPPSSCGAPILPAPSWRSAMRRPRYFICSKSSPPAPPLRPSCSASRSGSSAPPRRRKR